MTRTLATPWSAALALVAATLVPSDTEPQEREGGELRFVSPRQVTLQALPAARGAPEIGALFHGTAVLLHEEQEGFARVTVQAWVRRDALVRQRPPAPLDEPEEPDQETVVGLPRAHHIDVAVEDPGAGSLPVKVKLVTRDGRTVHFEADPLVLTWSLFEERRIAGGPVRGPRLARGEVSLTSPGTSFEIPVDDLDAGTVILSVQAPVSARKTLFGSRTSIPLKH